MQEIFKDIIGFEGIYQISNFGNVKSLPRKTGFVFRKERILKTYFDGKGKYEMVDLTKNRKVKKCLVHRLVAENFLKNPEHKEEVNHKDGNIKNNSLSNLEWVTRSENHLHAYKILKRKPNTLGKSGKLSARSRPVLQFSLDGKFLKKWDSANLAKNFLGYKNGGIILCCQGKYKTACGFIWKYAK